jgi:hypothetical protein
MKATAKLLSPSMLQCTQCGVTREASCNCGVGYVPTPVGRAALAVAAHPEKSDRLIGAMINVHHETVAKARKATGEKSPVRIGRDGKARKAPKLRVVPALTEPERANALSRHFVTYDTIPIEALIGTGQESPGCAGPGEGTQATRTTQAVVDGLLKAVGPASAKSRARSAGADGRPNARAGHVIP